MKSALQKYLRRRESDKMVWCAAEMYSMQLLADNDKEKRAAKGIVTNLLNRLTVMMEEEQLFIDWAKFLRCRVWLRAFEEGGRTDFSMIYKTCITLCGGEILRLNSSIVWYWTRGKGGRTEACDCPQGDISCVVGAEDGAWLARGGREYLRALAGCLMEGDCRAYKWAHKLMGMGGKGKSRWRRREPIWAAWEVMCTIAKEGPRPLRACIEEKRLEFANKSRKGRHMWLSSAVSLVVHRERINWDEAQLKWDVVVGEDAVKALLYDRERMAIDDYAIDQHCHAGRQLGRGRAHFRKEGGMVVRPNTNYTVTGWRE